jgi:hypothetical protein
MVLGKMGLCQTEALLTEQQRFNDSGTTSKKTHITVTKFSLLMTFRESFAVYSNNQTKPIKGPFGRQAEFLNVIAHMVATGVLSHFQTRGHIRPCLTTRGPQGQFIGTSWKFITHATNLLLQIGSHITYSLIFFNKIDQ